jgi:hypothetical protein
MHGVVDHSLTHEFTEADLGDSIPYQMNELERKRFCHQRRRWWHHSTSVLLDSQSASRIGVEALARTRRWRAHQPPGFASHRPRSRYEAPLQLSIR